MAGSFHNPLPTVDIIIEMVDRPGHPVVLIERRNPPPGWALPGGFVDVGETLEQAAVREALYNLEPNVKESPGGLRDAQMIAWVFKRHFGSDSLSALIGRGLITQSEYQTLMEGQRFLWKVRFALHTIANRREDRLLFDHQRTLAQLLGYQDREHKLAVEWFMKDYYRAIQELSRLNEMLLQLLSELILHRDDPGQATPINRRFQARKGFLEVTHERVFKRYPFALLELFLLMQQHSELKGVRASTIRLVRHHRYLIDDKFRHDIRTRSLFMEIFRQPEGLTHELRRMNLYGVLGLYIPSFGRIVGRMQYDLFHAYTVDEHTLFVVSNLRRFALSRYDHEFPHCSRIMQSLEKPEIAYLSGLFHDIAKGRGGDHSELGAVDAEAFCLEHGLSQYEAGIVAWLVRHHLALSMTAQKKDIHDPAVVANFARVVGDETRLYVTGTPERHGWSGAGVDTKARRAELAEAALNGLRGAAGLFGGLPGAGVFLDADPGNDFWGVRLEAGRSMLICFSP